MSGCDSARVAILEFFTTVNFLTRFFYIRRDYNIAMCSYGAACSD